MADGWWCPDASKFAVAEVAEAFAVVMVEAGGVDGGCVVARYEAEVLAVPPGVVAAVWVVEVVPEVELAGGQLLWKWKWKNAPGVAEAAVEVEQVDWLAMA